jgi:hypothetical protein
MLNSFLHSRENGERKEVLEKEGFYIRKSEAFSKTI